MEPHFRDLVKELWENCSIQAVTVAKACCNEGTWPASLKGNWDGAELNRSFELLLFICSLLLPLLKKGWENELLSTTPALLSHKLRQIQPHLFIVFLPKSLSK